MKFYTLLLSDILSPENSKSLQEYDSYCKCDIRDNIYAYTNDFCYVAGNAHGFEWPNEAIKPEWKKGPGDVIGCGILLNPDKKLAVFFTGNGILMGQFQCGIRDEFKTQIFRQTISN
jgi:hypothetical protein